MLSEPLCSLLCDIDLGAKRAVGETRKSHVEVIGKEN